jgi:small subunit ribosomal protein S6
MVETSMVLAMACGISLTHTFSYFILDINVFFQLYSRFYKIYYLILAPGPIPGLYHPKGGFMRRYETIFIIDPDLSDEGRVPIFERLKDIIPQQDGTLLEFDEWGSRRLAYEIKKKTRGYYVKADYCGLGAVVDEMERFFKIDDRILKYMTVLLEEDADVERLLAELIPPEPEAVTSADAADAVTDETADTPTESSQPDPVETVADNTETEDIKEA